MNWKPRARFAELGFQGPFPLDRFLIEVLVDGIGIYALVDQSPSTGELVVIYVGRGQLKRRLVAHALAGRATMFLARTVASNAAAFRRECQMYLRYGGPFALDNLIAPARPWSGLEKCGARPRATSRRRTPGRATA